MEFRYTVPIKYRYPGDFNDMIQTVEVYDSSPEKLRDMADVIDDFATAIREYADDVEADNKIKETERRRLREKQARENARYEIWADTGTTFRPTINAQAKGQHSWDDVRDKLRYLKEAVQPHNGYEYFIKEVD